VVRSGSTRIIKVKVGEPTAEFGFNHPNSAAKPQGEKDAETNLELLEKQLTTAQIAKGQELAAEYWEKHVVPFQKD